MENKPATQKDNMKIKILFRILALVCLLAASATPAFAQGTAFTYQGRLNDGTNPANGNYDLRFYLRDALVAGSPVGSTNTFAPVGVTNGQFAVTLDFGAGIFTGPARWLEMGVRTNGSVGVYTTLSPRQALTATPYAILAGNAGNLGGQPATAFAPISGSSSYVAKAGDTMSGSLNLLGSSALGFGNTTRQMLNLYQTGYGIGVQNFTVYQRSSGGFAWYLGGVHNDAQNNPGTNGTTLMTLDAYGDLTASGQVVAANGIVGSATTVFGSGVSGNDTSGSPNSTGVYGSSAGGKGIYGLSSGNSALSAGVWGEDPTAGGTAMVAKSTGTNSTGIFASGTANAGYFQGNVNVTGNESFGNSTRQMLNLWSSAYGIGVQNSAFYQRTANEFFWYKGGTHSDTFADPGAGGTQLMRLGNTGTLIVPAIQITGGADVAEPFQMSGMEIPEGSVVVIDEENPGQLKMSERAYDKRVAGIVSGANGIQPGLSLSQQKLNEGGKNVALTGRVYVLADAANGAIKPGDLLTASSTPGHAMKVTNRSRAQGAILGKAMSGLKQGKGMVLVLVTLQ